MIFKCVINRMSLKGKGKVYNYIKEYHIDGGKNGLLLMKVILDESGSKTYDTVMKEKAVPTNLPES